jgi:hypothetical protein
MNHQTVHSTPSNPRADLDALRALPCSSTSPLRLCLALVASLAAACGTVPPPQRSAPSPIAFSTAEHDPYLVAGSNSLKGQAFLRQRGGGVVTCAGSRVLLMPATPFFKEFVRLTKQGKSIGALNMNPAYAGVLRLAQCDAQGNFTFDTLAARPWLVSTEIKWYVPNADPRWSGSNQGGTLMREVSISQGPATQVLLSNGDLID